MGIHGGNRGGIGWVCCSCVVIFAGSCSFHVRPILWERKVLETQENRMTEQRFSAQVRLLFEISIVQYSSRLSTTLGIGRNR